MSVLILSPNGNVTTKLSLEAARTATDAAGKTVIVTTVLSQVQSNISGSWPSDRALEIRKGGGITNSTAFNILSPFSAGLYKVFYGAGSVTFGNNCCEWVYPEWWGAVPDGVDTGATFTGTDCTTAIQSALSSSTSAAVKFVGGIYRVTATLLNQNGYRCLSGNSQARAVIASTTTDYIVDCTGTNNGSIENLVFRSYSARVGLYINRSSTTLYSQFNNWNNLEVNIKTSQPSVNGALGAIAVFISRAELCSISNCLLVANRGLHMVGLGGVLALLPMGGITEANSTYDSMTSTSFYRCNFRALTWETPACAVVRAGGVKFYACYAGATAVTGTPSWALALGTVQSCVFEFHVEEYGKPVNVQTQANSNYFNIICPAAATTGVLELANGDIAQINFTNNHAIIQAAVPAANSAGVFCGASTHPPYISGNTISVSDGVTYGINYTYYNPSGAQTWNLNNVEITTSKTVINNVQDRVIYGTSGSNQTDVIQIPLHAMLVKIYASYAQHYGSDYHAYLYTLPLYNGTVINVIPTSLGASGTDNNFTFSLAGDSRTISMTTVTAGGAGQALYQIEYFYK